MPTQLVAILNLTPDSFSDGDVLHTAASSVERAALLLKQGADVLDVGAESTRPGAIPVSPKEEWKRLGAVLPEIVQLAHSMGKLVSVDTRHASTAEQSLAAGVDWINDVTGLRDDAMLSVVRGARCDVVVMHALSVPVVKGEVLPVDADVLAYMRQWGRETCERLERQGIMREHIILDPGIGFGTSALQSLALLRQVDAYRQDGVRMFVGHSRKSFMSVIADILPVERDLLTRSFSALLIEQGVEYIRVHDVAGHKTLLNALL